MTTIRVTVELDLEVEDSDALREAAASTMYETERDADRRGLAFTSGGDQLIEFAQRSDTDAVVRVIGMEPVLTTRPPAGTGLLRCRVRAVQLADGVPEGSHVAERNRD